MLGEPAKRKEIPDRVLAPEHAANEIERLGRALLQIGHALRHGGAAMRVMAAIEPNFRALWRRLDKRPLGQPLQAGRPFDIFQTPFDALLALPAPPDTAKGRDGNRGIG